MAFRDIYNRREGLRSKIMSSLEPGQRLRCIEADSLDGHTVVVGRVYTCAEEVPGDYFKRILASCTAHGPDCPAAGIKLVEIEIRPSWYWCSACFQPLGGKREPWVEALEKGIPISTFEEPKRAPVAEPASSKVWKPGLVRPWMKL